MPLDYKYERTQTGTLPIDVSSAKDWLKIGTNEDNDTIQRLLEAAVQWGEHHVGRDFRANTYTLRLDCFTDRILLRKSEIASITTITYTLATVPTAVATSVWALKKGRQFSEIILKPDQIWPTDQDEGESGILITFLTGVPRKIEEYKQATLQLLAYLYENRGDCAVDEAAKKSGAYTMYGGRVERI